MVGDNRHRDIDTGKILKIERSEEVKLLSHVQLFATP